jgi:TonB family protein
VTVKATIGQKGDVNAAEVIKSTSKSKPVDACVANAFKKMKFPPPRGGVTSVITFPMEFNGAEQVQ